MMSLLFLLFLAVMMLAFKSACYTRHRDLWRPVPWNALLYLGIHRFRSHRRHLLMPTGMRLSGWQAIVLRNELFHQSSCLQGLPNSLDSVPVDTTVAVARARRRPDRDDALSGTQVEFRVVDELHDGAAHLYVQIAVGDLDQPDPRLCGNHIL